MVGAGNELVATTSVDSVIPLFQDVLPSMKTMPTPFSSSSSTVNEETLLATNPDIVFLSSGSTAIQATLQKDGLCVVMLNFVTFPQMTNVIQQTGWILGPNELARANQYVQYFNQVISNVTSVTSQIPTSQRPSVYHISGTSPLYCDGGNSLIDTWINICGGTNAAASVTGTMQQVTMEQVLSWNPQVIIVGSATANSIKSQIMSSSQWSSVTAVQNGAVYVNPFGVFDWSRYSVEEALNIQWVAKTLYPTLFANVDMSAQTSYFYQTFYNYTLSNTQIAAILSNTPVT
jgi:iron complex transport system substrate-binding protein